MNRARQPDGETICSAAAPARIIFDKGYEPGRFIMYILGPPLRQDGPEESFAWSTEVDLKEIDADGIVATLAGILGYELDTYLPVAIVEANGKIVSAQSHGMRAKDSNYRRRRSISMEIETGWARAHVLLSRPAALRTLLDLAPKAGWTLSHAES